MELQFANVKIHLKDRLAYKWTVSDNSCVRGYAFVGDELLKGASLLAYLKTAASLQELEGKIAQLNGFYNFILSAPFGVVACVDHIRSMPLFYQGGSAPEIFDFVDEEAVSSRGIDQTVLKAFLYSSCTFHQKTLLKHLRQIQAGHYLLIAKGVQQKSHFVFQYAEEQIRDLDEAIRRLDESYQQTFRRVIRALDGRTAVIPLSGGHDSRLVAFYLKRLGYDKIMAYSYGARTESNMENSVNADAVQAQKAANALGIPWRLMVYDVPGMRKLYKNEYSQFALLSGNCTAIPHIQDWYAVYQLKDKGLLPEDSVFVPGIGGELVAGELIWRDTAQAAPITSEKLLRFLLNHTLLSGRSGRTKEAEELLKSTFMENFPVLKDAGRVFTAEEANQIVERNLQENYYPNFIENMVRVDDYFGYQWITPFSDRMLFQEWGRIHNSLRCWKKAYFTLAQRIYPESLNAVGYIIGEEGWRERQKLLSTFWGRARLLMGGGLGNIHYEYQYFSYSFKFYRDFLLKSPTAVDVVGQDAYLDLLQKLCGSK